MTAKEIIAKVINEPLDRIEYITLDAAIEAMKEYAKLKVKEQKKLCADNMGSRSTILAAPEPNFD